MSPLYILIAVSVVVALCLVFLKSVMQAVWHVLLCAITVFIIFGIGWEIYSHTHH